MYLAVGKLDLGHGTGLRVSGSIYKRKQLVCIKLRSFCESFLLERMGFGHWELVI